MKYSEIYTRVDTIEYTQTHFQSCIVTKPPFTNRPLTRKETLSIAKCKMVYKSVLLLLSYLPVNVQSTNRTDILSEQNHKKQRKARGLRTISRMVLMGWGKNKTFSGRIPSPVTNHESKRRAD